MTNLSTSEVLETDPEFKRLKEIVTEKWSRPPIFDQEAMCDVRHLLITHSQTLLKLERAKEALRFYAEKVNYYARENGRGEIIDSVIDEDGGDEARATLTYIKEGKE